MKKKSLVALVLLLMCCARIDAIKAKFANEKYDRDSIILSGRVIDIVHGNIIVMVTSNNGFDHYFKAVLYGVRIPDITWVRDYDNDTFTIEPCADEAYMFFAVNVFNQDVELEVISLDDQGREIGIVYLQKKNINLEVLSKGLGRVDFTTIQNEDVPIYLEAELKAKTSRLGVWGYDDSYTSQQKIHD